MAAYRRVDGLKSSAGWLPVHRDDQLWTQRSILSMGELYLFTPVLSPMYVIDKSKWQLRNTGLCE